MTPVETQQSWLPGESWSMLLASHRKCRSTSEICEEKGRPVQQGDDGVSEPLASEEYLQTDSTFAVILPGQVLRRNRWTPDSVPLPKG
jgi:hypothetical protein